MSKRKEEKTVIESGGKTTLQTLQTLQTLHLVAMAFEAWRYLDPSEIVEASIRLTERAERRASRGEAISAGPTEHPQRDAYYTQARRLHVKTIMKGRA